MIMVDITRHSSALSPSSSTVTPSNHFPIVHPEPEQNGSSSPSSHRRPSGFSSRSAFPFSVNPLASNSNNTSNLLGLSRAPSFSSAAAKFKSFSKYRSRRLSQDSLTDLSPPTHPDLDLIPQPRSASFCADASLKSSSPCSSSHRGSITLLGRSTKPSSSLSLKPSKDKPLLGNVASSFKPDTNQPSLFSLRLRLLSNKPSLESQSPDIDNKSFLPRYQSGDSFHRSHKPEVLQSIHNQASKVKVMALQPNDSDELEAIMSPARNDFRTVPSPNHSHRPLSILHVAHGTRIPRAHELSRSSSSPDLNFTASTFSRRPSQDSVRTQTTVNSFASPKRSKPPPPIKVPLPAGSIPIAVGNDTSSAVPSKIPTQHVYSSSESIGPSVHRIAGVHWSTSATKKFQTKANVNQTHDSPLKNRSKVDSYEDLTASGTIPQNVQIPISKCSLRGSRDKFPVVVPLQPAPRRPSYPHLHPSTDSKGRTLPLLISKHHSSKGNPAPADQHRTSYSSTSEGASMNTSRLPEGVVNSSPQISKRLTSFSRISQFSQSPEHAPSAHDQASSPSPKAISDPPERHACDNCSLSPRLIQFPTSEEPVRFSLVSDPNIASSNHLDNDLGPVGYKTEPKQNPDPTSNLTKTRHGTHTGSATSFDIRSFPLRLETTFESLGSVPAIAIPEPIKMPQIETVKVPSLSVTSFPKSSTLETFSKFSSPTRSTKLRPLDLSAFSPLRSGISNISTDALQSANRLFTPLSTSPSNLSTGGLSMATSKSIRSPSSIRGQSHGLSVDDFYVNINSNVLMDFSRRKAKKLCRPRSMSECEPSRDEMWTSLFGTCKELTSCQTNSPYSADYPLCALPSSTHSPRPHTVATLSIEQQIRESTPAELNKIVQDALKAYDSDTHRFVVGDINQLVLEAKGIEEKTKPLHLRYLNALRKREKYFEKHVIALRAFNPDSGARLGETLSKVVHQTDQLALELLQSIDSSSKLARTCDAHWRAAAAIQLQNLAAKEAQLQAAQCRIEFLESNRIRHVKEISDLKSTIDLLQYQIRPSSRATDADSIGSGSISSTNAPFGPGSPSATPRICHFPFNGTQRHGKIVQSRMRMSSAHSFGSAFNPNSQLDPGSIDSVSSTTTSGEPVSPRTAFLSSYGLSHCHAPSQEQSETLSQPMNKNHLRSLSSPKTDKTNFTSISSNPSIPLNTFANFHRSESTGPARSHPKLGSVVLRPLLTNHNIAKQKRPINGFHLRGNRSSSFNPSEGRNIGQDSTPGNMLAPWEVKPRSSSSALSSVPPPSQSATWGQTSAGNSHPSELPTTVETGNEFQPANNSHNSNNVALRTATSSSLLRFPRQAAPPPTLPLPSSEQISLRNPRRNDIWSPNSESFQNGNLSSIILSQLGSLDIANLINSLDSSEV